jgi:hypothetical protein
MVQRLTYRRRLSYNTTSNKVKIVKTPGGKLAYLHIGKKGTVPKCGDCGVTLQGKYTNPYASSFFLILIRIVCLETHCLQTSIP